MLSRTALTALPAPRTTSALRRAPQQLAAIASRFSTHPPQPGPLASRVSKHDEPGLRRYKGSFLSASCGDIVSLEGGCLYNIREDPHETNDLAATLPDVLHTLKARCGRALLLPAVRHLWR